MAGNSDLSFMAFSPSERRKSVFRIGEQATQEEERLRRLEAQGQAKIDRGLKKETSGLEAIANIREADKFSDLASQDLAGIENKRVQEQLDPAAMERFKTSAPLQEHIQDLTKIRDKPELLEGQAFEQGVATQPDFKAFTEDRVAKQTAASEAQKIQQDEVKQQKTSKAL